MALEIKAFLYAWLCKKGSVPNYSVREHVDSSGIRRFTCKLSAFSFNQFSAYGEGGSKKSAKDAAAERYCRFLIKEGLMGAKELDVRRAGQKTAPSYFSPSNSPGFRSPPPLKIPRSFRDLDSPKDHPDHQHHVSSSTTTFAARSNRPTNRADRNESFSPTVENHAAAESILLGNDHRRDRDRDRDRHGDTTSPSKSTTKTHLRRFLPSPQTESPIFTNAVASESINSLPRITAVYSLSDHRGGPAASTADQSPPPPPTNTIDDSPGEESPRGISAILQQIASAAGLLSPSEADAADVERVRAIVNSGDVRAVCGLLRDAGRSFEDEYATIAEETGRLMREERAADDECEKLRKEYDGLNCLIHATTARKN